MSRGAGVRLEFQTGSDLLWMLGECRARVLRSMRAFAEEEIVIPDGQWAGFRYSCERQPYSALWFEAIDRAAGITNYELGITNGVPASPGEPEEGTQRRKGAKGRRGKTPPAPPVAAPHATAGGITAGTAVPHSPDSVGAESPRSTAYREFIAVGPTQSGKTLTCFVIPCLYHLFEIGETVICVVPDLNMVDDKWRQDLLPAIKASRYSKLLPVRGEGSRGGVVKNAVTFLNGATLKFMTAGGGDTNRAAFTARIVLITEMNKFGVMKASSAETDMFRQVKGRTRSYGDRARIYGECTVTDEHGLVWSKYLEGTESRIAFPCGHCGEYVTPGREQLVGWEDARTVVEAERLARWCCPKCGVIWEEEERAAFLRGSVLLHRGQEIEAVGCRLEAAGKRKKRKGDRTDGNRGLEGLLSIGKLLPGRRVVGDGPETWVLGFRWSAIDNLFLKTSYLGGGEWSARHLAGDAGNAEREQLQFVWAMPVPDESDRSIVLRSDEICHRQGRFARGVIPPGAGLVAFLDLGKYKCHWVVLAGQAAPAGEGRPFGGALGTDGNGRPAATSGSEKALRYWMVDCGVIRTEIEHFSERDAMLVAMREFHGICEEGWVAAGDTELVAGERWSPALRFVDSGKWSPEVYAFMVEMARGGHEGYFPSKGFGVSQDQARVYTERTAVSDRVEVIGNRYHVARQEVTVDAAAVDVSLVHVDVDAWKSRVHGALKAPIDGAGSLVLWKGDWRHHMPVARSLISEVAVEEFVAGKGTVVHWEKKHRDNHFFDGTVGCFAALDYLAYLETEGEQWTMDNGQWTTGEEEVPEGRLLGEVNFGGALKRS